MIKIDFVKIGEFIERRGFWQKCIAEFDKLQMQLLCEAILEATTAREGFEPPHIDGRGFLIIPLRAPLKYRWWVNGGQSILQTLEELGANDEVKARYTPTGYGEGLSKPNH